MMDADSNAMECLTARPANAFVEKPAVELIDSVISTPVPSAVTPSSPPMLDLSSTVTDTEKVVKTEGDGFSQLPQIGGQQDYQDGVPNLQTLLNTFAASFPTHIKQVSGFNYNDYFHPARLAPARALHGPRLEKAKKVAVALLEKYYPADQGYRIEPVNFPLIEYGGWRTWVYPAECYTEGKRRGLELGLKKKFQLTYDPALNRLADKFHRILPEHIAGYVVLNEVQYEDGSTGWAQHTYMAIMMDDLETHEHWVPEHLQRSYNSTVSISRADILNDAMGAQAGISSGYAILMLGSRIEFYNYQAKPAKEEKPWSYYLGSDSKNDRNFDTDQNLIQAQNDSSCFSHLDGCDADTDGWMVDIRSTSPAQTAATLDDLFSSVVRWDVHYRAGYSLPGPQN